MITVAKRIVALILVVTSFTSSVFADEGELTKDEKVVKISGKVIDEETGEELTGVRFFFEGVDDVYYSDAMGAFDIETIVAIDAKLKVSYISYKTKIIKVDESDFFLIKLSRKK